MENTTWKMFIRSCFGPFFSAFGLNTDRITPNTDTFNAMKRKENIIESTLDISKEPEKTFKVLSQSKLIMSVESTKLTFKRNSLLLPF